MGQAEKLSYISDRGCGKAPQGRWSDKWMRRREKNRDLSGESSFNSSGQGMPLSRRLRFLINASVPAKINQSIRHLAKSETAPLKYAPAAGRAAAGQQGAAEELLRCEIPERRSFERHQHRTHLRL
jgi:hypothetical protein